MVQTSGTRTRTTRLAASPNFALCHAPEGGAYVRGETEPYAQYWLDERERMLFALFGRKGGLAIRRAQSLMAALKPGHDTAAERRRVLRAIAGMADAGVLVAPEGELSRYGAEMARDYLEHRRFPTAIVEDLCGLAGIGAQSRVLDLASGPGSLALAMARRTPHVSIMELSRGFVALAGEEAARRGLALETINESCNRLAQLDGTFDAITVSQALHWLDDLAVCKGVCRTLAAGGSFFVIHAAIDLADDHPLAPLLGARSALGAKTALPFAEEARALYRRISLLFDALDTPDVERRDPAHRAADSAAGRIAGAGVTLYRQARPMGLGFARAFLSETHIAGLGDDPAAVWRGLAEACDRAAPDALVGAMAWAVLHFRRGAQSLPAEQWTAEEPRAISYP